MFNLILQLVINLIILVIVCGSYILLFIVGFNLFGGVVYYSGFNGMGVFFSFGQMIIVFGIYYVYDSVVLGCEDEVVFQVIIILVFDIFLFVLLVMSCGFYIFFVIIGMGLSGNQVYYMGFNGIG